MQVFVFLIAAFVLAYQIVLMRMFSIAQWHHFAAMIISIALLGFGLSGVLLQSPLARCGSRWLQTAAGRVVLAFLVVVLGLGSAWIALWIPFTPVLIAWQPRQLILLLGVCLVLLVPFTAGAFVIALALQHARESSVHARSVGRVYAANLVGSGLGAMLGLAFCFLPLPVTVNQYKALPSTLAMAGSRILHTEHHPLGRVDLVDAPAFRAAPGLSLAYTGPMPAQQALFVDADGGSAINRVDVTDPAMEYLAWLPSAAAYAAATPSSVLVIGVGGGTEIEQALRYHADTVTGVELHPAVARRSGSRFAAAGASRVRIVTADGRAFLRRTGQPFDLVQVSLLDSLASTATGVGAANESYLYTVEAIDDCLERLTAGGILSITRWLKTPPRDCLRLVSTVIRALERRGVAAPGQHLVFVRGWATGTLLVQATPFTPAQVDRIRQWADQRVFDVDYFPGAVAADTNQRNVMDQPVYFRSIEALLGPDRDRFLRGHLFDLRPATDDHPYHYHFFRWRTLPHLVRTLGRDWIPFTEWGYLVSVATLVQAALASVLLLGLPAWFKTGRRLPDETRHPTASSAAVFFYFAALGLGFMFLEISLFQKFGLFLGNPLVSASVVIASFLVFAGVGATRVGRPFRSIRGPVIAILVYAVVAWAGLPLLFRLCLPLPDLVRVGITLGLLAPLAFFLGMPFALGLARAPRSMLARAWAVNGCFSVIGAVLASVLAMDLGFGAVMLAGAGLYLVAAAAWPRLAGPGTLAGGAPPTPITGN